MTALSIMWFRRDLRLTDHPALLAAAQRGRVLPVFVIDPALWQPHWPVRQVYLARSLAALHAATDGHLVIRHGDPATVLPGLAAETGAAAVHISADHGPYGRRRDEKVRAGLTRDGVDLVATGSAYAVSPGRVRNGSGAPYRMFTPFARAWAEHGWPAPPAAPRQLQWAEGVDGDPLPDPPELPGLILPEAGEAAALRRHEAWRAELLDRYAEARDRPDLDTTSRLSGHLRFGEIHPRTLLAGLGEHPAHRRWRAELAWREFYADVLWHHPDSARDYLRPEMARMPYDDAGEQLAAWQDGRTGYPFVDAGMRQLRAQGWMHNRVRMVVASFLVKDLHLPWRLGAAHFMRWLHDGDLASNSHGWQWVAGTGTDAAPYFRIFNPVTQARRFDPDGDYVRRWVPELREVPSSAVHEPWQLPGGPPAGYPARIVDHAEERVEALRRLALVTG